MDRISALRNVEEALSAFERGEIDLATAERRVRTVLRTYATEFDEGRRAVYQVTVADRTEPLVLVAPSPEAAREQASDLCEGTPTAVERVDGSDDSVEYRS